MLAALAVAPGLVGCDRLPDAERVERRVQSFAPALAAAMATAAAKVSGEELKGQGPLPALAPPGQPRILLSHEPTRRSLRQRLAAGHPAARRFADWVKAAQGGQPVYGFLPWQAALLGRLTDDTSLCTFAVQRTEAFVSEEELRIASGMTPRVAADSYLEVGPHVGSVALVLDWCRDQTQAAQRARWVSWADQAVWNVWHHRQARWGERSVPWTGWSTDNPVNNYHHSFLEATMLLGLATAGEFPQGETWLRQFRHLRVGQRLMPTYARDLIGGGSREGSGYGTAMKNLFRLYDWWERSTGERLASTTSHAEASMAHLMHLSMPSLDRLAAIGDQSRDASAMLFDYHREYLLVLMSLFPDSALSGIARTWLSRSTVPHMTQGFMRWVDFVYADDTPPARPLADLGSVYWAAGTGILALRSGWLRDATALHLICGPYTESHAHRDQGSFTIFRDGWVAWDANQASTNGIEQDEPLHNLVRFERRDGVAIRQRPDTTGCELQALASTADFVYAAADATSVYGRRSQVARSQREWIFLKPHVLVVFDRADASADDVARVWTLNTPIPPDRASGSSLQWRTGRTRLDLWRLSPQGVPLQVRPWSTQRTTIRSGVRIDSPDVSGRHSRFLHVLALEESVVEAHRSDDVTGVGVALRLSDGRQATLRFNPESPGGQLRLVDAGGRVVHDGPLPRGIHPPAIPWMTTTPKP